MPVKCPECKSSSVSMVEAGYDKNYFKRLINIGDDFTIYSCNACGEEFEVEN